MRRANGLPVIVLKPADTGGGGDPHRPGSIGGDCQQLPRRHSILGRIPVGSRPLANRLIPPPRSVTHKAPSAVATSWLGLIRTPPAACSLNRSNRTPSNRCNPDGLASQRYPSAV